MTEKYSLQSIDIMKYLNLKKFIRSSMVFVLSIALFTGCDNLLSVENPNSLTEEDVTSPTAANGLKNGLLHQLMDGASWTWAATSTVSDELYWTGSYESYSDFDSGNLDVTTNEIVVAGFPEISQARYMGDLAVENLTTLEDNGELEDPTVLTRALIYSALVKIIIAENYDNFVISNRTETSPPVGENNISSTFLDGAIGLLDRAVSRAETSLLEAQALGVRARAKHFKGVWDKLNPAGDTPADPLVSGTGASADAQAALDLMGTDYKAQFDYQTPLMLNYMGNQVNSRGEMTPLGGDSDHPIFNDLKTGDTDPRAQAIINDFTDIDTYTEDYMPLTWLSAREMHLIIAEEAVGTNDTEARSHINAVRSMDNLPDVEPGDDLEAFIEHERRANLFLQGRRLNDMYRFGTSAPQWDASQDPIGTLLPIPQNERESNPDI